MDRDEFREWLQNELVAPSTDGTTYFLHGYLEDAVTNSTHAVLYNVIKTNDELAVRCATLEDRLAALEAEALERASKPQKARKGGGPAYSPLMQQTYGIFNTRMVLERVIQAGKRLVIADPQNDMVRIEGKTMFLDLYGVVRYMNTGTYKYKGDIPYLRRQLIKNHRQVRAMTREDCKRVMRWHERKTTSIAIANIVPPDED
jgi:hypothetical protein